VQFPGPTRRRRGDPSPYADWRLNLWRIGFSTPSQAAEKPVIFGGQYCQWCSLSEAVKQLSPIEPQSGRLLNSPALQRRVKGQDCRVP